MQGPCPGSGQQCVIEHVSYKAILPGIGGKTSLDADQSGSSAPRGRTQGEDLVHAHIRVVLTLSPEASPVACPLLRGQPRGQPGSGYFWS